MNLRSRLLALWAANCLLNVGLAVLCGQDAGEKPAKKAAAKPAAAAPAKAATGAPAKALGKSGKAAEPAAPKAPELPDPAVEAILEAKPTAPADLFRGAALLTQLKRPDLAKKFLAQILAAKPDDTAWGALVEQFGTAQFVELTGKPELAPEALQVMQAMQAAAARRLEDPKRLAGFIGQLADPSAEVRAQAQTGLLASGRSAVFPLLAALGDPQRAAQHARIRAVLAALKSAAREPLVAALEAPDPKLAVQVIEVLAAMDARQAVVFLLAPAISAKSDPAVRKAAQTALSEILGAAPGDAQAAQMLAERAAEYFQGQQPFPGAIHGQVEVWHWDAAAKRPVAQHVATDDAARLMAARLSRAAFRIAPTEPGIRRLYLTTLLEEEAYRLGRDKLPAQATPAETEAAQFDIAVLEDVLSYALKQGHPAAATGVARVLGRSGKPEQVLDHGGAISPLVLATRNADRRLQTAALTAVVELQPPHAFAGSSFVVEGLSFLAASHGSRRVLAASPHSDQALLMVGSLASQHYEVDVAGNGRETILKALSSPDYEFAFIDAGLDRPSIDFVMQELRRDGRTAQLPVAIVAREEHLSRAEHVAHNYRLTLAASRPHDADALRWQVQQLTELAGPDRVPFAIRQQQAVTALELLAKLLTGPVKAYDVRRLQTPLLAALLTPAFTLKAVPLVAKLGTPESQRALVELASQMQQSLKVRQEAARAFTASVKRWGVLLTTTEILRQYDRYNQSEHLDRDTQAVLNGLLNSLELPSAVRKLKALRGAKAADAKPAETKPEELKPPAAKPADDQPAPSKPADIKPGTPKKVER